MKRERKTKKEKERARKGQDRQRGIKRAQVSSGKDREGIKAGQRAGREKEGLGERSPHT